MALFRSERGIGRGETAESQLEIPIFVAFMMLCTVVLVAQHFYFHNGSITVALAISMIVFGVTVIRVDYGVSILIIAMLLSPEIETGNTLSGARSLNLRYDDILILIIFLGVLVKVAYERSFHLHISRQINYGIVAYYSVCVVSTLLALSRNLGAWDRRTAFFVMLKMLEFYMVFFLTTHAVRSSRALRKQLGLFFSVALIVACYAIYTIGTEPRVSAPFEKGGTEPNTLGGYLTLCLCVVMGLASQAPTWKKRLMLISVAGLLFAPLVYTLSRASYLAIIAGTLVISVIGRSGLILGVIALVGVGAIFASPEAVQERIAFTFQSESGVPVDVPGMGNVVLDKSTNERILVWRKVGFILTLGPQYFLLGGGVSWESVLDSQYARVILETGMIGLFAFVFLQMTLLYTTRQAYRWTEDWVGRGLAMGMFAATLALIVHSAGTISFLIVRIMEPFWFLIALCVIVRHEAYLQHWQRFQAQKAVAKPQQEALPDVVREPQRA